MGREGGRRGPRRVVVAVVAVVVVLLAAAWGVHWWTHPRVFVAGYGTTVLDPLPLAQATGAEGLPGLGEDSYDETVTFTGYDVHLSRNTAHAVGLLYVCVPAAGAQRIGTGLLQQLEPRYCRTLRPVVKGTRFHVSDGDDDDAPYLVLVLRPSRAGTATADDLVLSYRRDASHLFQHGTQHVDEVDLLSVTAT